MNQVGMIYEWENLPIDIYADGPTLEEIKGFDPHLVRGYTFNPTLFRKLGVSDYLKHCHKLLRFCGEETSVSLEVIADDYDGMVRQARILSELGSNVYVKIPITFTSGETTLPVIEALVKDGLKLNITDIHRKELTNPTTRIIKNHEKSFITRMCTTLNELFYIQIRP